MRKMVLSFCLSILCSCEPSSLDGILGQESSRVQYGFISQLGPVSATVSWKCSRESQGNLYTDSGMIPSLQNSKTHFVKIDSLSPNTEYNAIYTCGSEKIQEGQSISFRTWISDEPQKTRGIWILGGIGSTAAPVAEVDLFDPVTGVWYPSVTSVPTPRIYSSILSHKGKIYVIGGLEESGGGYVSSSKVEVFEPYSMTWSTLTSLPSGSQGAVAASVGDEIYIVSGSNSVDMTNGPVFNTVLKFYPEIGIGGQWISYSSSSTIFNRVDMSGCAIDGTLFYTGGRTYNSGAANSGTDAFVPPANTTTSFSEPSLSESKHGAASLCIKPKSTDPFPGDGVWFGVVGGSTGSGNVFQPPSALTPTNKTEFYQLGSSVFSAGPTLPSSLYYPAVQISYETRKIFVFGGASSINVPQDSVYSLDSGSPILSAWSAIPETMPRRRYAHKALRIDR
ncbi:Kelch repeat-containing protein [Leptospira wolffii]|uniref:Kelch repeat-containing protein n=1 Tax=Leptospira wolffii TaxID=409998 RepID=UPI000311219C|nr:kelch repeat-containing protein [Leptospira wolffii]EPG67798.1 kelch repeat protein [Leptospira wolffii serovar Khorat str. Khorat-H2]